jgi:hypothetical protein
MTGSMALVGLDVHAAQTHAAVLDLASGELRHARFAAPEQVVDWLARLPQPLRAVYEAGPTGFVLARARHRLSKFPLRRGRRWPSPARPGGASTCAGSAGSASWIDARRPPSSTTRLLVEAAWHYQRPPRIGAASRASPPTSFKQAGARSIASTAPTSAYASAASTPTPATSAAARELACFLWAAATAP